MESNINRKKAPILIEPLAQVVAGPSQLRSFGQLRIRCGSTGRHLHVLHTHSLSNQPPSCPQFYFLQTSMWLKWTLPKFAYSGLVYSINSPFWLVVSFGCTLVLGQLFHLNKLARLVHLGSSERFVEFLECLSPAYKPTVSEQSLNPNFLHGHMSSTNLFHSRRT